MSDSAYYHVTDGEWLQVARRGNKDQCCDCGLVHRTNYRLGKHGGIEVQVYRDDRATAAVRRGFKFEKESVE